MRASRRCASANTPNRSEPSLRRGLAVLAMLAGACAGTAGSDGPSPQPLVAVLSAMPSELAPNLVAADVTEDVAIASRDVRVGELDGRAVVIAMTGIGTVNAATVAAAILDTFPVTGVVVSGVAHTSLRVGDVSVAETWSDPDGDSFAADPRWLDAARQLARSKRVELSRCSAAAPAPSDGKICADHDPELVVGGVGHTSDPFGGQAFPCVDGGGGVFGCAPVPDASSSSSSRTAAEAGTDVEVEVQDMETAVIAREAARRGIPFIAFRATSDSSPETVPSLVEFFHYYGLAAENASRATRAFLERTAG